jgi:sugar phosphate isomerase/epimerase
MGKVSLNEEFDFEDYLTKVEHMCKLTNIFGADKIRMFSFFDAYDKAEQVFEYLRKMVEVADRYGVKLCHENEKSIYGDPLERVHALMANVPGLKFIYDPANYIQCGEASEVTLPALHSKMEYFHIKDVIAETEELVPAGVGDGNIPKLVEMIEGDQVLTLEPHLAIFDGYATIDNEEMKNRFHFESNDEAFDYAVTALKGILTAQGYKELNGGFVK